MGDSEDSDDDVEKPALEYAGQGTSDERIRGSFDRDEDQIGRHDSYSSPKEDFEEDHGQNEEEKTWDEIEREFEEETESETVGDEVDDAEIETVDEAEETASETIIEEEDDDETVESMDSPNS